MISTSPLTEQHASPSTGGSSGRPTIMTYDPYLGASAAGPPSGTAGSDSASSRSSSTVKVPEFLRPLPKPARYHHNGDIPGPLLAAPAYQPPVRVNGIRQPPARPTSKYPPLRHEAEPAAINLVHKRNSSEFNGHQQEDFAAAQQRLYNSVSAAAAAGYLPPPAAVSQYYTASGVPTPIVTHQYAPLYFNSSLASGGVPPPTRTPHFTLASSVGNGTPAPHYINIPNSYSPPKPGQSVLKDVKSNHLPPLPPPPSVSQQQPLQVPHPQPPPSKVPFKVPSGKEGSLKHRILTRPTSEGKRNKQGGNGGLMSGAHFARGSLIQLTSGELRRIEDMKAEDFVMAAERSPALRLDPSTVVRITENSQRPHEVTITLSYGRQGNQQVELEVSLEHPFFVYGKGWASFSPERSMLNFDLPCHRLSVGDICISLSPRPSPAPPPNVNNNVPVSTPTPAPPSAHSNSTTHHHPPHHPNSVAAKLAAAAAQLAHQQASDLLRKRRWSAPDQCCSDEEDVEPPPPHRTKDTSTGF